ncbi:MAG: methionyl-tRNA formyltransferase [Bacteriovoracaceae bacterium]
MKIVMCVGNLRGLKCVEAVLTQFKQGKIELVISTPGTSTDGISFETFCKKNSLKYFPTTNINSEEALKVVGEAEPDLLLLAGFGQILKKDILTIPKNISINLHGGLLPDYKGSSPLNWAIINGEKKFGVSIIEVDTGIDTGDVLEEAFFDIGENETIIDVRDKVLDIFPRLLISFLKKLEIGKFERRKHSKQDGCYYPVRKPDDGLIQWEFMTADQVHNLVRALQPPYPMAFTHFGNEKVYIVKTKKLDFSVKGIPGRVCLKRKSGIIVMCKDRALLIETVQCENGKVLPANEKFKIGQDFRTVRALLLKEAT